MELRAESSCLTANLNCLTHPTNPIVVFQSRCRSWHPNLNSPPTIGQCPMAPLLVQVICFDPRKLYILLHYIAKFENYI